jgi:hypothetical protein
MASVIRGNDNFDSGSVGSTAYGTVGTYIWGRPQNSTNYTPGTTASSLYNVSGTPGGSPHWTGSSWGHHDAVTLVSGTWRTMTGATNGGGGSYAATGLWVRIS